MKCYICAQAGNEKAAAGFCRYCQIALCEVHLDEAHTHMQGGMHYGCNHVVGSLRRKGQRER